ncbi:MAG: hypothetical protein JO296_07845 [Pseudonocardiales bacterium]|nr:hypothetical protein [Pseudonocardiales bacterium]MBV9650034.1 hypothetical protein [Pseudonocardiales bacterium]
MAWLSVPEAGGWHAGRDMRVRIVVASVSIASVGMLAAACAGAASRTDVRSTPSRTTTSPVPATTPAPTSGGSWLRLSPQEGLRNATVKLDVACLDDLGAVRSPVLDVAALQPDPNGHQPWHLFGTATVRPDAPLGAFPVSATCGTQQLTATFTVVPHP